MTLKGAEISILANAATGVRLLRVEDEAKLAGCIRQGLEEENYAVDPAHRL